MYIRPETAADQHAIFGVTERAFAGQPHSDGTEPTIIDRLRKSGDLTLSLVAVDRGKLIGHVAFSPVQIGASDEGWFGLGPVAVDPHRQKRGIGKGLIGRGLSLLSMKGAHGVVLVGNPDYYQRFGFQSDGTLSYGSVPKEYVQALHWTGPSPSGDIRYSAAFDGA